MNERRSPLRTTQIASSYSCSPMSWPTVKPNAFASAMAVEMEGTERPRSSFERKLLVSPDFCASSSRLILLWRRRNWIRAPMPWPEIPDATSPEGALTLGPTRFDLVPCRTIVIRAYPAARPSARRQLRTSALAYHATAGPIAQMMLHQKSLELTPVAHSIKFLIPMDRKKDMIISGGFNTYRATRNGSQSA